MEKQVDNIFYIDYVSYVCINGEFVERRGQVFRSESFKAWVNSNENSHHNRPHLHLEFQGKTYVCSIDNIIEVVEPQNARGSIKNYIVNMVLNNLNEARKRWNSIHSNYKFNNKELLLASYNVKFVENKAIITLCENN